MSKVPASTSVEEDVMARIKIIAQVDRRSVAEVLAWCAERGLPLVEQEIQSRSDKLAKMMEDAPPYKTLGKASRKAS